MKVRVGTMNIDCNEDYAKFLTEKLKLFKKYRKEVDELYKKYCR